MLVLVALIQTAGAHAADLKWWPIQNGGVIPVRIHWQSFVARGFPGELEQLEWAVRELTRRLTTSSGVPIVFEYQGTNTGACVPGGVLIQMADSHSGRSASTFGCDWPNGLLVELYRENGSGTNYTWRFWDDGTGVLDVQSTLTHEFLHVLLGNDHDATGALWTSHNPFYRGEERFGPFTADVNRLRALWGAAATGGVRQFRSTDIGLTYSLFGSIPAGVKTLADIGAVRDDARLVLAYKEHGGSPCFILGSDTGTFDTSKWWCWYGLKALHGMAVAGNDDEYMFAWAEAGTNGAPAVQVVLSTAADLNLGTGVFRSPPVSLTSGTPSVARLGPGHWALAYTRLDANAAIGNGNGASSQVVVRITTNGGVSWSGEIVPEPRFRAAGSVTLASNESTDELRIGIAMTGWNGDMWYSRHRWPRVLQATASGTTLTYSLAMAPDAPLASVPGSVAAPAVARSFSQYHFSEAALAGLVMGRSSLTAATWTDRAGPGMPPWSAPAIAADHFYNFLFAFTTLYPQ